MKTPKREIQVQVAKDRQGTFEPQLIPKRQARFEGFDEEVLSLRANWERGVPFLDFPDEIRRVT